MYVCMNVCMYACMYLESLKICVGEFVFLSSGTNSSTYYTMRLPEEENPPTSLVFVSSQSHADLCPKRHNASYWCLPEQVQVRRVQESPKCIEGPCMSVSVSGCLRMILNVFPFNSILAQPCAPMGQFWILAVAKHTTSFAYEVWTIAMCPKLEPFEQPNLKIPIKSSGVGPLGNLNGCFDCAIA